MQTTIKRKYLNEHERQVSTIYSIFSARQYGLPNDIENFIN